MLVPLTSWQNHLFYMPLINMLSRHSSTQAARLPRWYRGADIPRRLIRRFAREVADRIQPEKIILFGSYAYGQPLVEVPLGHFER